MKKLLNIFVAALGTISVVSCADLNLNPLSSASSGNWYSTPQEIRISLNDFYRESFFIIEHNLAMDRQTDDWAQRNNIYPVAAGTIDATTSKGQIYVAKTWSYSYKNVSRANRILEALDKMSGKMSEDDLNKLRAEARFFRAYAYARLITLWGDVPFYLKDITPEEAFLMGRTDKKEVLKQIYEDYDFAAEHLPVDNNSATAGCTRVDKGCALAFKARIALYQYDYQTAAEAAKACMDLNKYSLFYASAKDSYGRGSYGQLFQQTSMTCETIFSIPHSNELEIDADGKPMTPAAGSFIPRSAGGTHNAQPSWELLAVYEMANGKTIDEPGSGFDPHNPFAGRDPRCCQTFVAPGERVCNIEWNPAPDKLETYDYEAGKMVTNKDSKGGSDAANCSYNGCCLAKGVRDSWRSSRFKDNPVVLMRYADVLLMYAEAKIELNQIDGTVLDCINAVRARAYDVKLTDVSSYPAITTTDQAELRKVLRRERRVELAWENLRYFDLVRWRQFKNAFSHNMFGFSRNAAANKAGFADGKWFWPQAPTFDEDGFPEFEAMVDGKFIVQNGERMFNEKVYLWPLPNDDVQIMNGILKQNPGY